MIIEIIEICITGSNKYFIRPCFKSLAFRPNFVQKNHILITPGYSIFYFFPGSKGRGLTIVFKPDPAAATQVLERLLGITRAGAFLPVGEPEICRYCDFARVCGDAGVVGGRAKAKIEAMAAGPADALRDWRMLRDL